MGPHQEKPSNTSGRTCNGDVSAKLIKQIGSDLQRCCISKFHQKNKGGLATVLHQENSSNKLGRICNGDVAAVH